MPNCKPACAFTAIMKHGGSFLWAVTVWGVLLTAYGFAKEELVPLTLTCRIFSSRFSDFPDGTLGPKDVTLTLISSGENTRTLVEKTKTYEFWVASESRLTDHKTGKTTIAAYTAEIVDTRTGLVAQALSDSNRKRQDNFAQGTLQATVSLVRYEKETAIHASVLKMFCFHKDEASKKK